MKMDYNLAKQLKEAGFPQDLEGGTWECAICQEALKEQGTMVCEDFHDDFVYAPTLSELIDECEEDLVGLSHYDEGKYSKGWFVSYSARSIDSFHTVLHGETIEEALTKLYIKLNEKD